MADIAIFRINYKSDFILTLQSDAGWLTPFCIKFWTGAPSNGYFAGFDGENYVNCRVGDEPTKLLVMFDDHHMLVGPLRMQIVYHTTIEEFPGRQFDEVTNVTNVTVDIDGTEYQVMLDFTGESGAEIDFSMPSSGVMSVNGKIGYVTLNAEDVGAQPTIEDLEAIRSGAAAGATAVQPAALQQGLATKQDTITDLSTIRSGAAAGATAVQPVTLQEGLATKQNVISDLATIRSGAAAGATAVQPAGLTPIESALQTIESVIPSAASSQNQLADKNFVNSSISTNTANFVGTYNSLAELQAVQNPTNNDYGFVIETDAQGNEYYDRYKYVAASQQWLFEYKVESTPFTAAQWAAIQSGITSALVTKLNALPTNAELQQTLDGKADTSDIPTALSQLSQDSTHRVVTDAEKSTWNGKQNAISDLATIRSGAAAGATAVQPAAMNTALAAKQDTLTFDNAPTANSNNPVKSSGIKTALDAKQSTISTVNVTVDNNTGTPSGSASVSGSTLSLSFQNLKGATGATGATGPQGPQGERGLPGESGVTGDVSGFTVIQTIDPSATYGATDIAGAAALQAANAELTELAGYEHSTDIAFSNSGALWNGTPSSSTTNNYTGKIKLANYDKVLYTGLSHGATVTYWTGDTGGTFVSQLTQVQLVGSETDAVDVDVKAIAPTTATYVQLSTANSTHANPPSVTPSVTCINYTTVKSVVEEIQSASCEDKLLGVGKIISLNAQKGICVNEYEFEIGKKYEITISVDSALSYGCTAFLRVSPDYDSNGISIGEGLTLLSGETEATVIYTPASTNYKYFTLWNTDNKKHNTILNVSVKEKSVNLLSTLSSLNADIYGGGTDTYSLSHTGAGLSSYRGFYDFVVGRKYKITAQSTSDATSVIGVYLYPNYKNTSGESAIQIGRIAAGERTSEFIYSPFNSSNYHYIGSYCTETHDVSVQIVDITDSLKERVAKLESIGTASVEIYNSDIAIDLSTEVLDLTDKTYTANSRFNGTSIVTVSGWKLLNDIIPITAGVYHVVDNTGSMILFQLAYVNSNGDILKSFDIATGHFVSNHFLRTLGATGIKIAVRATSLSGLHLVNGRKFKIVDEAKRNTFNNLCSDGRINVAYMKDSSDVNRIVMALKLAGSYGVVFIPSGRYELSSCIYAGVSGQSIEMESDTMLVASNGFTDDYLMEWEFSAVDTSDPEFPNTYGESSALANAHITGGVFNAKGLCGCLRVHNFRGLKVSDCQFYNASTKAVSVERPGYELIMHGCAARNDIPGLTNNIGFNLLCNDCHYYDLITVNYHTGFKVAQNAFLTRCHPWIGSIDFPTYYSGSIGFDLSGSIGTQVTDCYSDTMQTHYKLGQQTKLIGCTALSYVSDTFPIDEYGNVNLIHNDYNNNVIIGCTFRTSDITPVRNSGSKEVTEIGCTYT